MRALLIDAGRRYLERDRAIKKPYPHAGLAYVATALSRSGVDVKVLDVAAAGITPGELAAEAGRLGPALIGISAMTFTAPDAFEAAAACRSASPGSIVVMGGVHATLLPERTLLECPDLDAVVAGEGEQAAGAIAGALERVGGSPRRPGWSARLAGIPGVYVREGRGVAGTPPNPIPDLDSIPFPDWGLYEYDQYLKIYSTRFSEEIRLYHVNSSRGCPFSCSFCSPIHGKVVRTRSPAGIVAEIEHNHGRFGARHFDLADSNATLNRGSFLEMCALMCKKDLARKISWNIDTSPGLVDRDLFLQAREAGCEMVSLGIESGDDFILRKMRKGFTREAAEDAVRWAVEAGLRVKVSFVLGHPYETAASARGTFEFALSLRRRYRVEYYYNLVDVYPRTGLYDMVERGEGGARWIAGKKDDWRSYSRTRPMIEVGDLTEAKLLEMYDDYVSRLDSISGQSFYEGGGELVVVGVGFGRRHVTQEVRRELESAAVVAGHESILGEVCDVLAPDVVRLPDDSTRDRAGDVEDLKRRRVRAAVEAATRFGKMVYVCSGDPGVYSYAQPLIEEAFRAGVKVRVLPGVTSALVAGAALGAPLRDGFAVVGLYEDRVPEELVFRRVRAAAEADYVLVLYLPKHESLVYPSMFPPDRYPELHPIAEKAVERLPRAFEMMLAHRRPDTPVGIASFGGEPITFDIADYGGHLEEITPYSTLIVGSSMTTRFGPHIVTSVWRDRVP